MKILVTGGAGFIGSHLVDKLVQQDHEVLVFDNLFRGKKEQIADHIDSGRVSFFEEDIRNYDAILTASKKCHIIFHLAAQSNVIGAISDIEYSFNTNVVGTYNTLKAAHANGVKRFIFSSSRESYGEAIDIPVDESQPLNAKNSYGASKVAGEKYCEVFKQMYEMDIAILRFANVYGKRDFDRVIPIFIENALHKRDIEIYGGKQVIDFISIEKTTEVLLDCITNNKVLQSPVNIGSGKPTTLFDLAEIIKKKMSSDINIRVKPARDAEVVRFVASLERYKKVFDIKIPDDPLYYLDNMLN